MTSSMDSRCQAILEYTAAGKALIPCKPDKRPNYKRQQETRHDPNLDPTKLPSICGVLLTDDDLVLDVDPRR